MNRTRWNRLFMRHSHSINDKPQHAYTGLWKHTEEKIPARLKQFEHNRIGWPNDKSSRRMDTQKVVPFHWSNELCGRVLFHRFSFAIRIFQFCGLNVQWAEFLWQRAEAIDCEVFISAVQFSFSLTSNLFDSYTVDPSSPSLLSKQWNMSFVFFFFHSTRIRVQ